ncbi:anthranilate phosphoribosyltransferase [Marasmius fiardii PR-910]|nr:anthranilate phosphoribosyltransferase [Marasmius fiardii PR-910]
MPIYTPHTFKPLLKKLVETPEYFTSNDLKTALCHLFAPDCLAPEHIGAFLTALHIHRVERRPESLAVAANVLRERALKAIVVNGENDFVVDIVGTGGDGYNLFNVSTTAGIVAAGAGARVIKHGSKASTSSSGSADLLQALGCAFKPPPELSAVPPEATPIPPIPFSFILAPHYHPSLAFLQPLRRNLPFRTMFNVLGPLINPAFPKGMVLGVAEPELGRRFAESLREGGVIRALVVCGYERLDEISCSGKTHAWELKDGQITEQTLSPDLFGLDSHPLVNVAGGNPTKNAEMFRKVLNSGKNIPEEVKPILDFILINASALLVVAGLASDYKEGVRLALESIVEGRAWQAFETFKKHSTS